MFGQIAKMIFGNRNDREVKRYRKRALEINALEDKYKKLSDDELKIEFGKLKERVKSGELTLDSALNDSFAITREASVRVLGMRHFDVQLIGGIVLHDGKIAEMKTGEGKTLVATLPVCLNAMTGKGVHIITVNDYLASRDGSEMGKLYNFLGYSVGIITSNIHDEVTKKAQYDCDITYGTNNEYGFDYLRDNMKYDLIQKVQRGHHFAIVDEVDSILIDEARTPLIISGPTSRKLENYVTANEVALKLKKDEHYTVDEKNRVILLTEDGITEAEKLFRVDNLYSMESVALSHHLDQALKANNLFAKDVDYVVKDDEIIIVDEFTGRLSEGRRYSEGLHQALEAKEGVAIKEESQTLADITFQNYFRFYQKLAGMTGTAQTEAAEFSQIYNLDVISIPTNVPAARKDNNDLIYKTEREKFDAVVKKIKELNEKGQPILVGTASIEKSEKLSSFLKKEKVTHTVLNAKQHEKEAEIIKDAGKKGAVTIATNMAGRGVDIKIDDEIRSLGGLYIIGTERHESRRIDNQLRGRSGRQGDPGASQFYLSLEDNLLRIFGSDKIKGIMERLGIEEGEHIESGMVTRAVENAQKKIEAMHFESRKHLLEYDDVANEQRKAIYRLRDELLNPHSEVEKRINENRIDAIKATLLNLGIVPETIKEEFDYEKIIAVFMEEFGVNFDQSELESEDFDVLLEKIILRLKNEFELKMALFGDEQKTEIERILYLQVLDSSWREHLYQMDVLKTGIGLRGYNQKDPLTEYKKESYNLFMEMFEGVKLEAIKTLQTVRFRNQEERAEEEAMAKLRSQLEFESQNQTVMRHKEAHANSESERKISRNDLCPCGSGKKYKYCHGKSGPKKGILA